VIFAEFFSDLLGVLTQVRGLSNNWYVVLSGKFGSADYYL
jgi:hypothetical protein